MSFRTVARCTLLLSFGSGLSLWGQTLVPLLTPIYTFGTCGAAQSCPVTGANANVVEGGSGVLYGVGSGGEHALGTVLSLTPPPAARGAWTVATLYNFSGSAGSVADGADPISLVSGNGGVLYGITSHGGANQCQASYIPQPPALSGCGTAFSLTPPATAGGAWTEAIIYNFTSDQTPAYSIGIDANGALYVMAGMGIFSLVPPTAPSGKWNLNPIYTAPAGENLRGGLVVSGSMLFGESFSSVGISIIPNSGEVFSLAPPQVSGGAWSKTVIYAPQAGDAFPTVTAVDSAGVVYGTVSGGSTPPYGSVFSLTPPAQAGGAWTAATLYDFNGGSDGFNPYGLAAGTGGVLFGFSTTNEPPPCNTDGCATVFALTPPSAPGGAWTKAGVYTFTNSNPGLPEGGMAAVSGETVYGNVHLPSPSGSQAQGSSTAFSLKMVVPQPAINAGGLVTAASYTAPVAPGSIASVFGEFFVPAPLDATQLPLPTSLSGLSFQFDSLANAPLFFVDAAQVNLQVPWELAGESQAALTATLNGLAGDPQTVQLAPYAPAIFTTNAAGTGQGAILDQFYQLVDASNPAKPGATVLQIFCTGLGAVSDQPPTGSPASLTQLSQTTATPTVTVASVAASVSFSGLAPGFVGLYQVNAQVPAGIAASSAVPVVISMNGVASNTVTIAVQ